MIDRVHRLVFVHVPKCAGMAVEAALGGLSARQNPEQHWTGRQLARAYPEEWSTFHRFAVVRHPLERARSWVRFLRRFDPIWRRHCEHVPDHVLLRDTIFSQNLFTSHTAHRMLTGEEEILRLEDLDTAWPVFAARHRLPRELPQRNRAPSAPSAPLPEECEHLVAALFPEDFERFGYPLPSRPVGSLPIGAQGAVAWARLHAWARRLPERMPPAMQEACRAWLDAWRASLPEPSWRVRFDRLVAERTPDMSGGLAMQRWAEALHEDVNLALGKRPWLPWKP